MTKLYVDFNEMARPGVIVLHARRQPEGSLPALSVGDRIVVAELGDDEEYLAVAVYDEQSRMWHADVDALRAEASSEPHPYASAY